MVKEKIFYPCIVALIILSISGIPYIRYSIYALPLVGFIIYATSGNYYIKINRVILPFLLLLVISLFNIFDIDYNRAKQFYFIFCYTSIFLMYDFSKNSFNIDTFNVIIIVTFIVKVLFLITSSKFNIYNFSLLNSNFALENTLSFVFGLFCLYYYFEKKYVFFIINLFLALISFKRIVIIGILFCLIASAFPKKIRNIYFNPIVISIFTVSCLILLVNISLGFYDNFIINHFGVSTNQLIMGRQVIWSKILIYLKFEHIDYLLFGIGNGSISAILKNIFKNDTLLHSDFLVIMLQYGYFFLISFTYFLNNHIRLRQKSLSLYLTLIFFTDNILIYQHVMIPYMILMSVPSKIDKK